MVVNIGVQGHSIMKTASSSTEFHIEVLHLVLFTVFTLAHRLERKSQFFVWIKLF